MDVAPFLSTTDAAPLDAEREQVLNQLAIAWEMHNFDLKRSLQMSQEASRQARELQFPVGLAYSYRNIGFVHYLQADYENALRQLQMALRIFIKIREREGEGSVNQALSYVYIRIGDYAEAVSSMMKAHQIAEVLGRRNEEAQAENGLGLVNVEMDNLDQGIKHFQRSESLFAELHDEAGRADALDGIGRVYRKRGSYGRSLEFHLQALAMHEKSNNLIGKARCLLFLGRVYQNLEDFSTALSHYHQSLRINDNIGDRFHEVACLIDVGSLLLDQNYIDEAFVVLFKALSQAGDIRSKPKVYQAQKLLSQAYEYAGNFERAYEHHLEFHELRERVYSEEARGKLRNQQVSFATEKTKSEAEIYRLRNIELARTNTDLERVLELTNDSIAYARRIQDALLPNEGEMKLLLPDSFVYYRPRDIVSGDFYWITEWNDRIILAAVDCTGHGVPGAFMSVLGQSLLNQVVKENYTYIPGQILQKLDERLLAALQQTGSTDIADGMEAAIVTINVEDRTAQYAGANIPLYLVNSSGLTVIPATSASLGGGLRRATEEKTFTTHTLSLGEGDTMYLFSDGFRDQFGANASNKLKYSTKRFQRLLIDMFPLPMDKQKETLAREFDAWKGRFKQLDDVMVLGVRI
jgi:serine phosphatase RsbU (regulator of sigma subunit)